MANNSINAASNPDLVNKLVKDVVDETQDAPEPAKIVAPSEVIVDLPGGYITSTGEVLRTAEVRELDGRDEEAISKATSYMKSMLIALQRGTVSIGEQPVTEAMLDGILSGDRDAIMLGIYRATFGDTATVPAYCGQCKDYMDVTVDIVSDIKTKVLVDPIGDRTFTVQGRSAEYTVRLPEGKAQREIATSMDKTNSELDTLLLEYCVTQINGAPVFGKAHVQKIGLADRRTILKAIIDRNVGPQFDDLKVSCPDCSGEVVVPINLGTIFRI